MDETAEALHKLLKLIEGKMLLYIPADHKTVVVSKKRKNPSCHKLNEKILIVEKRLNVTVYTNIQSYAYADSIKNSVKIHKCTVFNYNRVLQRILGGNLFDEN
jgi:hypothetical protein